MSFASTKIPPSSMTYVFVTGAGPTSEEMDCPEADAESRDVDLLVTALTTLEEVFKPYTPQTTVLVHGGGRGVDKLAAEQAERSGWAGVFPLPSRSDRLGDAGHSERNRLLVRMALVLTAGPSGHTVHWHAFPAHTSRRAWDCVQQARDAAFHVVVHPLEATQ